MKAKEVITIGRSRSLQAARAASRRDAPACADVLGELDDQDRVLAGQADQHHEADLGEDVDVGLGAGPGDENVQDLLQKPEDDRHGRDAQHRANKHMGTTRITASGIDQLSYWAASTRKTMSTARAKMYMAVLPAWSSR